MRANTNVAQKKRYTAKLSDFRGVDLSSSPLRVSTSRATYMRNFISENGVNHKRPGWRELLALSGRINGIFPFLEGAEDVLLVHAGTRIFRVACTDGQWSKTDLTGELALTDSRSQCFYRDGRAFFVGCGDYLAYGPKDPPAEEKAYTLQRVRDIAYIPTTTTAIQPVGEGSEPGNGGTLDAVNLLTPLRKNVLSCVGKDAKKWYLDRIPDDGSRIEVELDGTVDGYAFHAKFSGAVNYGQDNWLSNDFYESGDDVDVGLDGIFGTSKILNVRVEDLAGSLYGARSLCSVNLDSDVSRNLSITATFSCTTEGYEDKVKKCSVGALFGVDGASDRLFVSGNPDEIGMDRWSEAGDFTYFPDGNAMYVGGSESAITGYTRLSDSTMAIFKEQMNGYPTIYYRTGRTTSIVDADGTTVPAAYFPVDAGAIGEGLVSPACVGNLAGDPLILSPNGVFGIELSANVSSGERYAKERSRAIYEELRKKDLSDAVACVYRGRYYLSTGDGACYIADSRYKASFDGSPDMGYEWWIWDNVAATAFAMVDNALLFGDAKGRLCAFEEGVFSDRTYAEVADGDVTQNDAGGLTYNSKFELGEGDGVTLEGELYACLLDSVTLADAANGLLHVDEDALYHVRDGVVVYADNVAASGLSTYVPYTVADVDPAELTFKLKNADGEQVKPATGGFRLCICISGRECFVKDVMPEYFTLHDGAGCLLTLVPYDGAKSAHIVGRITHYAPVIAQWRTPVMDLGTNSARKCLLGITMTNEPGVQGAVRFSMETRLTVQELLKHGGTEFSLDSLDFSDFSFATGFAESCRRRVNVRNFNFAVFEFSSDTASDVAVNGIELEYKINQVSRGVH